MFGRYYIAFFWCLLLVIAGCETGNEYIPELYGNIAGTVYTFDEFGQNYADHTGVTVTAFGLDQKYIIHTRSAGKFEFLSIPAGTYEIHFEKKGFGTLKQYGVQHLGGTRTILPLDGTCYHLFRIAETEINRMEFKNDSIYINFTFKEEAVNPNINVILFTSTKGGFEKDEAEFIIQLYFQPENGNYKLSQDFLNLWESPYQSGTEIFVKGCVFTKACQNTCTIQNPELDGVDKYYDPFEDITIFPNMGNLSAQYKFIYNE